jgi:uncharacterized membrane protein YkvI
MKIDIKRAIITYLLYVLYLLVCCKVYFTLVEFPFNVYIEDSGFDFSAISWCKFMIHIPSYIQEVPGTSLDCDTRY